MSRPLVNAVALVTGASRGIGYAVAKALAADGAHVVALARTVGGLEELDDEIKALGGSATLVPLDLTDHAALDRLGASLFERWKRLDVLIANAAVLGRLTPVAHLDPKVWERTISVNVTANWRLLRSLDPLLRASPAGRAIFVSSGAAANIHAYWGAYSISKAALEALAKTYAAETVKTEIKVSIVNPGPMRTRLRAEAMPGEDPATLPDPAGFAAALMPLCRADWRETGAIYDYRDGVLRRRG